MVRVLHIFYNMGNGGIEHFVMDIYRKIDRTKVQFDFLTSVDEQGFFDQEIIELGGRIHHAYPLKKNPIKNFISISRIVKENNYIIVHRHTGSAFGYYELRAARAGGAKKLILHSHNPQAGRELVHKISKSLLSIDCIKLACSRSAGEFLFGKNSEFKIIKNGIDCDLFSFDPVARQTVRKEWQLDGKLVVGHIGRFEHQKNHQKLLAIFKAIHSQNPESKLFCIGTGSLMDSTKKYAEELRLQDSIIFAGSRDDVHKVINAFDLFCFPSFYEGFSITQIEAQVNGLKCFASAEVIPPESNISGNVTFVPLEQPAEYWARQILSSDLERDLNAVNIVKKAGYDLSSTAVELQNLYLSMAFKP